MAYNTQSPITYVTLKRDAKSTLKRLQVMNAAKAGDSSKFTVIPSSVTHHAIVDNKGFILGYRYRVPSDKLNNLIQSTASLPSTKACAGKRGQYPTCHYAIWRKYNANPFHSKEYLDDLPASEDWCNSPWIAAYVS